MPGQPEAKEQEHEGGKDDLDNRNSRPLDEEGFPRRQDAGEVEAEVQVAQGLLEIGDVPGHMVDALR